MLLSEQLVGEARARRQQGMSRRERTVLGVSAALYLALAIGLLLSLPSSRETDLPLTVGLIIGHALVSRVRFEFGNGYVVPEQLVLVPFLLLLPLNQVLLLVAAASVLALIPDILEGRWHKQTLIGPLADSWAFVGPVLVLAAWAPAAPDLAHTWVYALAFAAQLSCDSIWSLIRNRLLDGMSLKETLATMSGVARVDATLSPLALMITLAAVESPYALLSIAPLVWLLEVFSRDREARYASALELQRAYRGTVTLLSDVVEFDDPYTAAHSRSIVELAEATAEKLGVPRQERQRLEFAALLHDIGKIAIPKEILNKPASLTSEEFAVMKTHTIEGQYMLDRVGGLLGEIGEIVRSCHERWDGQGYPDGISGEDIPLIARIVFACDAYNAMTTDRVYRHALSVEEAIQELTTNAGTQFDPTVVGALLDVVEEGEPMASSTDEIRAILARSARPERVGVAT
jgi:HD-GYP domain-containing protein (c-di-GMP phosphodiesterase class II)